MYKNPLHFLGVITVKNIDFPAILAKNVDFLRHIRELSSSRAEKNDVKEKSLNILCPKTVQSFPKSL